MTSSIAYARSHTAAYVSDKIRTLMKRLIRTYGLDPQALADAWDEWVERAARTWMETGHLYGFVIEFYRVGGTVALGRWDFPIRYDGDGEAALWVDDDHFAASIAKAGAPPSGCTYRILLQTHAGRPEVPGVITTNYLSIGNLTPRETGTMIVTPDLMASARYYKK